MERSYSRFGPLVDDARPSGDPDLDRCDPMLPDDGETRRIGPWVLRAWHYDPADDGTPDVPASWWWSVCLAGTEECDAGVDGAHEVLLWIGAGRCDSAEDGWRLALDALRSWVHEQAVIAARGA